MQRVDDAESEFCDRALNDVSRTFALSIRALPAELRLAVRTAYLLCRIVDTVEDDRGLSPTVRADLFEHFDQAVHAALVEETGPARAFEEKAERAHVGRGPERLLCGNAAIVFRAFAVLPEPQRFAIAPRILEMSRGMSAYSRRADQLGGLRITDLPDLERYCHYVAGTVGELLTDLFVLACPAALGVRSALDRRAARFGIGLQLVNILKDVADDALRGDCFLPESVSREHGVELHRLFEPEARPRALALCRALCAVAREHLAAAEEYTLLWPSDANGREVRSFCAGPLSLAFATLRQVELGTDTLVRGRAPTISRDFVIGVFAEIARAVEVSERPLADAALRATFERARVGIAGRPSRPPAPAAFRGRLAPRPAREAELA